MSFDTFVVFLLPPIIGAVIGLFTNWLAIKMLFRPLREYRIFGLRVPFTPGILPRERHGIAVSLGDTVAGDLLTHDAIAERLGSAEFRAGLETALSATIGRILSATPESIAAAVSDGADPRLGAVLRDMAGAALRTVAASPAFSDAADAAVGAFLDEIGGARVSDLADSALVRAIAEKLADPGVRLAMAKAAGKAIMGRVRDGAASGRSLDSVFSLRGLITSLVELADAGYDGAGEAVCRMLGGKAVRASMEKAAAKLLRKALDRFNAVQRFFIGLGQYDKAILENVPASVSDFLEAFKAMLAESSTRESALGTVAQALEGLIGKPLGELRPFSSEERLAASEERLVSLIRGALDASGDIRLPDAIRTVAGEATAGELLEAFPGAREGVSAAIVHWLAGMLSGGEPSGEGVGRVASAFAHSLRRGLDSLSLGQIIGADPGFASRLASASSGLVAGLAVRESSAMLKAIDLRSLVVAKIDSLDIIEVERMLLRVMDKELKAVTWFGAVLGFAIGLSQSLLSLFR